MRSWIVIATAAPFLLATPALAQNAQNASQSQAQKLTNDEQQFLDFADQANRSEIQAGLLAESKAQAPAVKAFARLMVLDHTELQSQLDAFADNVGVQLPDSVGQQHKQQMSQLSSQSGAAFDRAYMQAQVQDHEKVLSRFRKEAQNAQDARVRGLAAGAAPILGQHLALAGMVEHEIQPPQASNAGGATTGSEPSKK